MFIGFWFTSALVAAATVPSSDFFVEEYTDASNVLGGITDPNASTKYIKYLGNYKSTEQCTSACTSNATANNKCESFTFMTAEYPNPDFVYHCYGLFGRKYGSVWTAVPDEGAITGRLIYPCTSNLDCSLNGQCDTKTGNCTCDAAWSGYHCGVLNVQPATQGAGYVRKNNISTWGGSVLVDPSDTNDNTKYHMYLAQMDNHCGLNTWVPNSKIVHAQSTQGFNSEYVERDVVHSAFAHEPDAIYGPNGEFVIYYIAANASGLECECKDGSTPPNSCNVPPIGFTQLVQYANNPSGPWSEPIVIALPGLDDPNLAGVILENGSFVGLGRNWVDGFSSVYLIQSDDWKNGDKYTINFDPLFPQLTQGGTEDPFVYRDCNGGFHAIFNNQSPNWEIPVCGGHAYSSNGVDWVYTGYAFGNNVEFDDGSDFVFSRRERPHFVFDDDGCTPIGFTTGAQYGGRYGDATETQLQPLGMS